VSLARMDVREGGTWLGCMREPKEFGGQDMFSMCQEISAGDRKEAHYGDPPRYPHKDRS
jgi:hypothetical protein